VPHRTPNLSALLERAKSGDSAQAVKAYLDAGGLATAQVDVPCIEAMLRLPLLHSIALTNAHPHSELTESVRLLLAAGADIEACIADLKGRGRTALMCATEHTCCTAALAAFMEAGADPCARSSMCSDTAPHIAAQMGLTEGCRLLLARSETLLEARGSTGRTPLHCAASGGHVHAVQELLQRGADVNAPNNTSRTPLFSACCN
jgi:ankyrin repeat protein